MLKYEYIFEFTLILRIFRHFNIIKIVTQLEVTPQNVKQPKNSGDYGTFKVPNSDSISCSNSSLLECSPVTQAARIRFPAEACLSRVALVKDGDDLGKSVPYAGTYNFSMVGIRDSHGSAFSLNSWMWIYFLNVGSDPQFLKTSDLQPLSF
jgi:hypothetical protein